MYMSLTQRKQNYFVALSTILGVWHPGLLKKLLNYEIGSVESSSPLTLKLLLYKITKHEVSILQVQQEYARAGAF